MRPAQSPRELSSSVPHIRCAELAQLWLNPIMSNLPAYTVGSLRAHVQVECLVDVVEHLVSSDAPQEQLHHFTQALHQVFAFGRSTKHMIQRHLGRLEPTTSLKYRADEVMRNMPALSS